MNNSHLTRVIIINSISLSHHSLIQDRYLFWVSFLQVPTQNSSHWSWVFGLFQVSLRIQCRDLYNNPILRMLPLPIQKGILWLTSSFFLCLKSTRWQIKSLTHISSLNNNLPFLGTVKSSFICYGTWEKLVHCIQTLILTTDTAVALNQLENTVSDSQPWTREPLWKSTEVSNKEVPAHGCGGRVGGGEYKLCALERVRGTVWFYSSHPSPKWHNSGPRENFLAQDFSHRPEVRGQSEHVIENLASPAVDDVVKEAYFSLASSRVCSSELLDWRVGKSWEKGR